MLGTPIHGQISKDDDQGQTLFETRALQVTTLSLDQECDYVGKQHGTWQMANLIDQPPLANKVLSVTSWCKLSAQHF